MEEEISAVNTTEYEESEEEKLARRAARRAEMKKQKKRQKIARIVVLILVPVLIIAVSILIISAKRSGHWTNGKDDNTAVVGENDDIAGDNVLSPGTEDDASGSDDNTIGSSLEENENSANEVSSGTDTELSNSSEDETQYPRALGPFATVYSPEKDIFFEGYKFGDMSNAAYPSEESVFSNYALLMDAQTGDILVSKNASSRINPASMTKIMTILVAAEHVDNLESKVSVSDEIANYIYVKDLSAVNFSVGEQITVEDVMYGTILPSGADAALVLAEYIAGSEEEFVKLMNDKLRELGLSKTAHFTNCTGEYNENHYCTLIDMAMIMKAAVENNLAKKILTAHKYTTSMTEENPDGITISNWFLRRIEDKDTHGEVICAKTGYVKESGCCAASYEISNGGGYYICVTADTWSAWRCIYDHVAIYETYVE